MSQSSKMNAALKKYVFQPLLDNGFTGKYPHYRLDDINVWDTNLR